MTDPRAGSGAAQAYRPILSRAVERAWISQRLRLYTSRLGAVLQFPLDQLGQALTPEPPHKIQRRVDAGRSSSRRDHRSGVDPPLAVNHLRRTWSAQQIGRGAVGS